VLPPHGLLGRRKQPPDRGLVARRRRRKIERGQHALLAMLRSAGQHKRPRMRHGGQLKRLNDAAGEMRNSSRRARLQQLRLLLHEHRRMRRHVAVRPRLILLTNSTTPVSPPFHPR